MWPYGAVLGSLNGGPCREIDCAALAAYFRIECGSGLIRMALAGERDNFIEGAHDAKRAPVEHVRVDRGSAQVFVAEQFCLGSA